MKRRSQRWNDAYAGRIPAEQLPQSARRSVIAALHTDGYTTTQIAHRTALSGYTVIRIRTELEREGHLPARQEGTQH